MNAPSDHIGRAQLDLRVEFVRELAQLEALRERWEVLNATGSDHDAPFFQSHAWNVHVARVRLTNSAARFCLLIATVWRGGALTGIWPLALQRAHGAWIARGLDEPFGQFAGALFASVDELHAGVAAVLRALRGVADGLALAQVIVGSPLYNALVGAGAVARNSNEAVYLDLRPYASFDAFKQQRNKKTLKNLRNLRNRLERTHGAEHHVVEQRAAMNEMIAATFAARLRWLDHYGRTSPAFRDSDFRAVIEGLAHAPGIDLLGFSLTAPQAQTLAAAQWGFQYQARYYAYVSARNPDFDEFSPGRMHLGMVIEACLARGLQGIEFMAPASDYKLDWSSQRKTLASVTLPFTLRGRFALRFAAGWAAPKLRALSRTLPQAVRKPLIRLLNRR